MFRLFTDTPLALLRDAKLISPGKLANLLAWKHSGFNIHNGGEKSTEPTEPPRQAIKEWIPTTNRI